MLIILGDENAQAVKERHVVLELDRFRFGTDGPVTSAWCVIEHPSISEIPHLEDLQKDHVEMIDLYRTRKWEDCVQKINRLLGCWNKEVDSFYDILRERCVDLLKNPPPEEWDYVIEKTLDSIE